MANTYRVSQGDAKLVDDAQSAVEPGRYDKTNWATDWILINAYDETSARRIARAYDAKLNSGKIERPRYLKPIGRFYVGETR